MVNETRKIEYTTGDTTVRSKEFTVEGGRVRLNNSTDALEFLNYSISTLVSAISELNESIDSLKKDIRQIRVGNEAFVYGEEVADSDEVAKEDIEDA